MIKRFKTFQKRNVILGCVVLLVVAALAFSEKRASAHEVSSDDSEHGEESLHSQIQSLHDLVLSLHGPNHEKDSEPSRDRAHSSHDASAIIEWHRRANAPDAEPGSIEKRVMVIDRLVDREEGEVLRLHLENLQAEGIEDGIYRIELDGVRKLHWEADRARVRKEVMLQRDVAEKLNKIRILKREDKIELRELNARTQLEKAKAEIVSLEKELNARKMDLEDRLRADRQDSEESKDLSFQ
ncbi:MAG: hypothetical protein VCD00_18080 [Candidatus Hydrogenedentota bacterium]